jgi:uncharacterized protein YijF (DUF1287 family)
MKKQTNKGYVLAIALCLSVLLALSVALVMVIYKDGQVYYEWDFSIQKETSAFDFNQNGKDDYADLLAGAKRDAANKPTYDGRYWENAYPPDDIGVCTDVVWRAFREAGYSLRYMVDYDVRLRPASYPNITKPDDNIDFRRVVNLKVFFDEYALSLTLDPNEIDGWQGGDIVIFANSKGRPQHIGVISDRRTKEGVAYVLHNGGQEDREEDFLFDMTIIGHYRFDASKLPEELLIPWEGN